MDFDLILEEAEKPYGIKHRSFFFAKDLIMFIKECKYDRIDYSMFDQLLRSATSIGANIIEGKAGSTKKDWIRYLTIGLKSANETKYWLCLIRDTVEIDKNRVKDLLREGDEISKILASIILNASKK